MPPPSPLDTFWYSKCGLAGDDRIMANFRKWTKRLGVGLLAVVAVMAMLWSISRALYPTDEQLEALAIMQMPAPPAGDNAFAALWTLDRAVPPDDMPQVIEIDAARIAELPQFPDQTDAGSTEFVSAAEQYPDLAPSSGDRDLFCNSERENCLEKVAADPSTYRALVERNRALLDRIDALADYDFVRQQLPWNMSVSLLVPGRAYLSTTRNALWFAEGRIDDALAASCRSIDTWRRLGASGDTLILRLIANAFAVEHHGEILAEMLAELPVDHALPAACGPALAPPTPEELSICTAMRGEFALMTATTGPMLKEINEQNWWSPLHFSLLYDARATEAAQAQNFAPMCAQHELERIAADRPEIEPTETRDGSRFACLGNLAGCFMSINTASAYSRYRLRMQDFGARLELLATLAWLRENADRSDRLEELLEQRPEAFKSATRQVSIGENGASLHIPMFGEPEREPTWSVPLPAALQR